ncbi:heavy metal translocating P-type ATPase [Hathewaya limosa]
MMNKENILILKGLDCPNCAAKIESKIKSLANIQECTLNFSTLTLSYILKDESIKEETYAEIKSIIHKLEPDVEIMSKNKPCSSTATVELILEGLHCANCAAKIENKVNELPNVHKAIFNFSTSILTLEINNKTSKNDIFTEVKNIVNKTEPDVVVKFKKSNNSSNKSNTEQESPLSLINKKDFIRIGIGTILFLVALIGKFTFYTELTLFIISYLSIGGKVLIKALKNFKTGEIFDENFLMVIATLGAFAIKEFPEAVAVMLFYEVGETFQNIAVNRSRKSIADLMDIKPDKANLKVGDSIEEVSPDDVSINDIILVKPFEKVPLDGIVIEGESSVDTSALTGESLPRNIKVKDEVLSGFINQNGMLYVKVTKSFSQSTVSKILDLVQNAGSKKAEAEKFITKFAKVYTPLVVICAIALTFIPPMFIKDSVLSDWVRRSLIFLVVSCPCALVISIPLGFFGGIGAASKKGVLIKGSNYLEALNSVDTIVFDKTGTLTKGIFEVTELNTTNSASEEELLRYAAICESYSSHPIAKSIISAYNKPIDKNMLKNYEEIAGHGTKVDFEKNTILVGNSKLMDKFEITFKKCESTGTVVYIAVNNQFIGSIVISDKIKQDSVEAINQLKSSGINNTIMLTGDNKITAEKVAKELKLDTFYAELLPQEKVKIFEEILQGKKGKSKVAFVGDGINDAPVLARADIGIAMGGLGSDAAIEAADMVIMNDEPSRIFDALKISKFTRKIVTQNIILALGIKLLVLILAALGLANMWEAVFADVGVALLAILNSMRILKLK